MKISEQLRTFASAKFIQLYEHKKAMLDAADRIEELEAKLAAKSCPLGDDCDLTVAYMAGAERAKDTIRQLQSEIAKLKASQ